MLSQKSFGKLVQLGEDALRNTSFIKLTFGQLPENTSKAITKFTVGDHDLQRINERSGITTM
jgi:hypothetical protein